MSDKRDEYTYMARLAEQTERWEDMVISDLNEIIGRKYEKGCRYNKRFE